MIFETGKPSVRETSRLRWRHAIAAATTIVAGLLWHLSPPLFGAASKDKGGDALWAAMMFFGISFLLASRSLLTRALIALVVCFAVEASQLYHAPWIDRIRSTLPGHLVLGSGFDWRDLVFYAIGVLTATFIDRYWLRQLQH